MSSASELTNYFGPISLFIGGVWTLVKYRNTREERARARQARSQNDALRNDANLRDDQREFIAILQNENKTWRAEVTQLRNEIESLRREMVTERRAREAAEARYLEILERRPGRPVDMRRPAPPDGET